MHSTWLKNHNYYLICSSIFVIIFLVYALSPYLFSSEVDPSFSKMVPIENIHFNKSSGHVDNTSDVDIVVPEKNTHRKMVQRSVVVGSPGRSSYKGTNSHTSKVTSVISSTVTEGGGNTESSLMISAGNPGTVGPKVATSRSTTTNKIVTPVAFSNHSDSLISRGNFSTKSHVSYVKGSLPIGDGSLFLAFCSVLFVVYKFAYQS